LARKEINWRDTLNGSLVLAPASGFTFCLAGRAHQFIAKDFVSFVNESSKVAK
jgi:hypothetical protein